MISNFPGDFLGEPDEYDKTIMYIYVGMLDFQNMELVQAPGLQVSSSLLSESSTVIVSNSA